MTVLAVLLSLIASDASARAVFEAEETPVWEQAAAERRATADSLLAHGPEVAEPFFAFLTELAYGDSLGSWSSDDLVVFAQSRSAESRFPMDLIDHVERRRPDAQEQQSWPAAFVRAVWEVILTEPMDRGMPYSILGYHPGSLRVSRRMKLTEIHKSTLTLHQGQDVFVFNDVIMFRLDEGHVILDVDGFVDRMLGKMLDDAATVGFVLARQQEQLMGLAVSLGRNGRSIYGEFDFRRDKILPHGRPLARALSTGCRRRMLYGYEGPTLGVWVED